LRSHVELGGIEVEYVASESVAGFISKIIDEARSNSGAVLQHLVGAKLEKRFDDEPDVSISHNQTSVNDKGPNRQGDFDINSSVLHVTKRASPDHYRKAKTNAENGRKTYILVPHDMVSSTLDYGEDELGDKKIGRKINIWSIEQFIAQNIDELAGFDREKALAKLSDLIDIYNSLIQDYEGDPALKVVKPDFGVD
jgi:hypothetical protein